MPKKKSPATRGALAVTNAIGGRNATRYAGQKLAKAVAPKGRKKFVSQSVTGKQAARSVGNIALAVGSLSGAGVARAVGRKVAGKAVAKKAAKRTLKSGDTFKVRGQKKPVRYTETGTNPTSLNNLKGDKKNFQSFRKAATRRRRK